ncbi:hypothetical protein GCM10010517_56020 [Streptosporangium fragile]|uniref:Lipoprotein n=1 Tax=Streptosporangium fragile TaxID=46186 RepID=A0ABN3W5H2_9ACTN
MKRHIVGLACAATAVLGATALAPTAHASAQAADPVTALKKQISNGRGVTFVDTTKVTTSYDSGVFAQRRGSMQPGASGIKASDQTTKLRITASDVKALSEGMDEEDAKLMAGLAKPERVVRIKDVSYISGGIFGQLLPEGKTWLQLPGGSLGNTGRLSQLVNVAEPATLKALLAHAVVKRPTAYAGKITFGELYKVSPWFRAGFLTTPTGKQAKTVVDWKLYLGADGLAKRLTTTYPGTPLGAKDTTLTVDTRYSGWGSEVTVKAPPADQVATQKDLQEDVDPNMPVPLLGGGK